MQVAVARAESAHAGTPSIPGCEDRGAVARYEQPRDTRRPDRRGSGALSCCSYACWKEYVRSARATQRVRRLVPADAGAEGGASASRRDPRLWVDALRGRAGILQIDVLRCDLYVVHGGFDVGVSHQLHECGQADTCTHHVRCEGMSEAVRVSDLYARSLAMVAEQGVQTGGCHAGAACWSLENDEQSGGAWIGPFQAQIVIDQLRGLRCEGEEAQLAALAPHA